LEDFAPVSLQRKLPLIRRHLEVFVNIVSLRLVGLLSHGILRRVISVSGLNRSATHTGKTATLSRSNLPHPGISPNASLVHNNKRDTLTEPRSGLRRHNINPT